MHIIIRIFMQKSREFLNILKEIFTVFEYFLLVNNKMSSGVFRSVFNKRTTCKNKGKNKNKPLHPEQELILKK